jgi:hypothetical protein
VTDNYDIDELSDVAVSMDENGSIHFSRSPRARTGIEDPTDPEFPDVPPPGWAKPE